MLHYMIERGRRFMGFAGRALGIEAVSFLLGQKAAPTKRIKRIARPFLGGFNSPKKGNAQKINKSVFSGYSLLTGYCSVKQPKQ